MLGNYIICLNSQVVVRPDNIPEPEREKMKRDLLNLSGALVEEQLFKNLQSLFENRLQLKNTIVINGWKDNGTLDRSQKEFDFLILSLELKSIFHIEAKKSSTEEPFGSASTQLENGLRFFQSTLPFSPDESWHYCRIMYFDNCEQEDMSTLTVCEGCKSLYIIDSKTDLAKWWNEITTTVKSKQEAKDFNQKTETYLNIVKFLLHQMYIQNNYINDGNMFSQYFIINQML